jgi:DNA-binding transcriptional LysR family regulator
MTNIPTDLLRTFVAVVDLRGYSKAAARLGVTQPAVSAQIKRLQFLLGSDLFDRSVQGVGLTPQGEMVINYARRLLSINDQIVQIASSGRQSELLIRVGTPSDFVATKLPGILAPFRERWPDVRFIVHTDVYESSVRKLRGGDIDILIGLSMTPPQDARHSCAREMIWVRSAATRIELDRPVPLISYGQSSVLYRHAVAALKSAGFDWEVVFTGPSLSSLRDAVSAGLGVMTYALHRAISDGMTMWEEDSPLPKLPDLYAGIYVREGGPNAIFEQVADEFARKLWAAESGT